MRTAHTRSGKPLPFVVTVLPVFFYLALIGLGYYVYVVSLCVPLIRNGRVGLGVVLVVIFHIIFFLMLWSYTMVILVDPGRVIVEPHLQQPHQQGQIGTQGQTQQHPSHIMINNPIEPHIQQVQDAHVKGGSSSSEQPAGIMIPGAQSMNKSGYIRVVEDPSARSHPLWCAKCEHVKPERAHHCRVCKRCVLKMDHHCPWILNCVGQDNYKFFVLFVAYTTLFCLYILISLIPLYVRYSDMTWTHELQVAGMVLTGIFGFTLVAFTISHIRLILLNRTTIEDHMTPMDEGPFPCFRKGWSQSEGEVNQGNERLYDLGLKENWEQAMGKGWKCIIPVRFPRPEGPIYNQKVVARQWQDYNRQLEAQKLQEQQGVPQQTGESTATVAENPSPTEHDVNRRQSTSSTQLQTSSQLA